MGTAQSSTASTEQNALVIIGTAQSSIASTKGSESSESQPVAATRDDDGLSGAGGEVHAAANLGGATTGSGLVVAQMRSRHNQKVANAIALAWLSVLQWVCNSGSGSHNGSQGRVGTSQGMPVLAGLPSYGGSRERVYEVLMPGQL
eukprot:scaffold73111_cov18-Tisochrysis_lutea.AAC.1